MFDDVERFVHVLSPPASREKHRSDEVNRKPYKIVLVFDATVSSSTSMSMSTNAIAHYLIMHC
jgi:hypothetical protein